MTCSAPLSAQPLRQGRASETSGSLVLQSVRLRSTVSALAVTAAALSWPLDAARAACVPTLTPSGGQTVTCDSSQPNPVTTGIVAQPGSTNVIVNMLSGAQLNVGGGDAIVLGGGGQVTNSSGAIIQGVRGINITGPATIANDGQIGGNGGPGVLLGGAGNSILTNTGQINGSGAAAVQFNTVAGFSQTFNNTGNGSINGNFVGSGDGGIVIVNGGNFNGGITISGNGTNSITTQSGRNINGQVSITGNSQNTIVNAAAFNNGLVISGAGTNSITNQAGAFINQTFTVAGTQNVVDNAGTLNNGLVISGGGINTVTNRAGATINQTFSLSGSQNIVDNSGTLNNGVTVSGDGVNSITNGRAGVINQTLTVTGNPQSTVTNFGTVNATIRMSGTGSVFNEGIINGGVDFTGTPGAGPFTLTLAPGQTINGNVLGTGSDTFQLGSSLILRSNADTFNVSNIGPGQQYRGFSTFNKIGTSIWTLTGTGAQNWNISGGGLIGDTNSLQGPAITNNAALVFSQNFSGTYAGSIGGSGDPDRPGRRHRDVHREQYLHRWHDDQWRHAAARQRRSERVDRRRRGRQRHLGHQPLRPLHLRQCHFGNRRIRPGRPGHHHPDREQQLCRRHDRGGRNVAGRRLDRGVERGDGEFGRDAGRHRHGDREGGGDHDHRRRHAGARRQRRRQPDRRRQSPVPELPLRTWSRSRRRARATRS